MELRAKESGRSLNSYVMCLLSDAVLELQPNEETIAAIEEARSNKDLEVLDLANFQQYVASL